MAQKITLTNESGTVDLYPESVDSNIYLEGTEERLDNRLEKTPTFKNPVDYEGTLFRDADRLGGYLPSYYAKETELNLESITTEKYRKDNVGQVVNALSEDIGSKQNKLLRTIKSYQNITIPSTGYIKIDDFATLGLSETRYLVSMNVRGWASASNPTRPFNIAKSTNGLDIYVIGTVGETITNLYVEYWYF